MMMLDHFDEIQSASTDELLRLYRQNLIRNTNGGLDQRLERIIAEIKRRNTEKSITDTAFVSIQASVL